MTDMTSNEAIEKNLEVRRSRLMKQFLGSSGVGFVGVIKQEEWRPRFVGRDGEE